MKSKKGFMSISIIYSFLILFLLLMFSILISYSNKLNMVSSLVSESKNKLKEIPVLITLYEKILTDNTPQSDALIDFNSIDGNGLYYTADNQYGEDGERIYYYRGRVDNNWISFGGYLWRIVRTTSEGGVKLVYSGDGNSASSGFINISKWFNTNYTNKYSVGYTYNTDLNGYVGTQTNSGIKTEIDTWYTNNLSSYASYLSDTTVYCNDRSSERISGSNIYYPAYDRIVTNKRPTYACSSINASRYTVSTETGNGYLQNPIALLIADEINYAGARFYPNLNINSYITDNATGATFWWTMSPYFFNGSIAHEFYATSTGYLNAGSVYLGNGVRPVVSLKSCITVVEGNGNKETPYLISNTC